jgi:GR25 family glycosyltransferase involved in LPS biosynthesis
MIDVLLICYNRSEYTKLVLGSLVHINNIDNLYISVDSPNPNDEADMELVNETINIIESFNKIENKYIKINNIKLGCKKHVKSALRWYLDENNDNYHHLLILEDDIVLIKDKTQERINLSNQYSVDDYFVLKFNKYFWGWIVNKKTIQLLLSGLDEYVKQYEEIKNDIIGLNEYKNTYNHMFNNIHDVILSLEPISKNIYVPWDEEFPIIMGFNKILDIKCNNNEYYVDNIGVKSSRDNTLEPTYNNSNNLRFYIENGKIIYY